MQSSSSTYCDELVQHTIHSRWAAPLLAASRATFTAMGLHDAVAMDSDSSSDGDGDGEGASCGSRRPRGCRRALTATRLVLSRHLRSLEELDEAGHTPIMRAAARGRTPIVDLLLAAGASLCAPPGSIGTTAWHCAAAAGQIAVLRRLLPHMAPLQRARAATTTPTTPTTSGVNALQLALAGGHITCARWLVQHTHNRATEGGERFGDADAAPGAVNLVAVKDAATLRTPLHLLALAPRHAESAALCSEMLDQLDGASSLIRFIGHCDVLTDSPALLLCSDVRVAEVITTRLAAARAELRSEALCHISASSDVLPKRQETRVLARGEEEKRRTDLAGLSFAALRSGPDGATPLLRFLMNCAEMCCDTDALAHLLSCLLREVRDEAMLHPTSLGQELLEEERHRKRERLRGYLSSAEPNSGRTAFHLAATTVRSAAPVREWPPLHPLAVLLEFWLQHVVVGEMVEEQAAGEMGEALPRWSAALEAQLSVTNHSLEELEATVQLAVKPLTTRDARGRTVLHCAAGARSGDVMGAGESRHEAATAALGAAFAVLDRCVLPMPPTHDRVPRVAQSFAVRATAILEQLHAVACPADGEGMWPVALAASVDNAAATAECFNALIRLDASFRSTLAFTHAILEVEIAMIAAEATAENLQRSTLGEAAVMAAASLRRRRGAHLATTGSSDILNTSNVTASTAATTAGDPPTRSSQRATPPPVEGHTTSASPDSLLMLRRGGDYPSSCTAPAGASGSCGVFRRSWSGSAGAPSSPGSWRGVPQRHRNAYDDALSDTTQLLSVSLRCFSATTSTPTALSGGGSDVNQQLPSSEIFGADPRAFVEQELRRTHPTLQHTTALHLAVAREAVAALEVLLSIWTLSATAAAAAAPSMLTAPSCADMPPPALRRASAVPDGQSTRSSDEGQSATTDFPDPADDAPMSSEEIAKLHPLLMPAFDGNTPLMAAAAAGNAAMAEILLERCGSVELALQQCLIRVTNVFGLGLLGIVDGSSPMHAKARSASESRPSRPRVLVSDAAELENPFHDPDRSAVAGVLHRLFSEKLVLLRQQRAEQAAERARVQQARREAEALALANLLEYESRPENPITRTIPYALLKMPGGLDHTQIVPNRRDEYLSTEEFESVFGVSREMFNHWTSHKKDQRRNAAHLPQSM